jgi:DNA mismatch repair ATPase MutS
MMRQFNALKEAYPDCILLFRSGDFYEMFGEDARRGSEALQIALTTRNKGSENEIPMCGVPYHAYEQYLNRLTAQGFKVAIAEQMEDPATAKGLVRREVVRVVTPGTTVSGALLEGDQHRYIVARAASPSDWRWRTCRRGCSRWWSSPPPSASGCGTSCCWSSRARRSCPRAARPASSRRRRPSWRS